MKYKIWQVYEKGQLTRFYVVNMETKKVQSTWSDYGQAAMVCRDLNRGLIAGLHA